MRRTPFYNFFIVALLVTMTASVSAQQVDSKLPWSVRLTESEMIRYPAVSYTHLTLPTILLV